jgi:adenylate cyclase
MTAATDARLATFARVRSRLIDTGYLANGVGGVVVIGFLLWITPTALSHHQVRALIERSLPLFVVYMLISLPFGNYYIARRPLARVGRWLSSGEPAPEDMRALVLDYARTWAFRSFGLWAIGAVFFAAVNLPLSTSAALDGASVVVLGGLTACSLQYVLVERIMRPVTALVLADGVPSTVCRVGVGTRLSMAWLLTTGVPQFGIAAYAVLGLSTHGVDRGRVIGTALFLSLVALSIGLAAMLITARSVALPLQAMRDALARVETGDLSTRVTVDDASEIGLLQAGFNQMSAGLVEREKLREAFGTYVDPDLTERVLREGTDLSGEEVDLSVLFLDVRNFTEFAERSTPQETVARLNELYAAVVPIVVAHRGHANKFIGDGLMAVFGAPDRVAQHADHAVAAALEIIHRVRTSLGDRLRIGVGVNSGRALVGTVGGGGRLDFTVIGDTVNTASRVESTTKLTGDDLLITEATRSRLTDPAAWLERPAIELRGKQESVRLYAPAET